MAITSLGSACKLGQWQVRAYKTGSFSRSIAVKAGKSHKLALCVDHCVAKASLFWDQTQGAMLTLTLADTAGQP
jgi:hypothetical protein